MGNQAQESSLFLVSSLRVSAVRLFVNQPV